MPSTERTGAFNSFCFVLGDLNTQISQLQTVKLLYR